MSSLTRASSWLNCSKIHILIGVICYLSNISNYSITVCLCVLHIFWEACACSRLKLEISCQFISYLAEDPTSTHMKKAVMLFKGSKGAQFLFTAKYQNN